MFFLIELFFFFALLPPVNNSSFTYGSVGKIDLVFKMIRFDVMKLKEYAMSELEWMNNLG